MIFLKLPNRQKKWLSSNLYYLFSERTGRIPELKKKHIGVKKLEITFLELLLPTVAETLPSGSSCCANGITFEYTM